MTVLFFLLKFLITGFCNSSANSLAGIYSIPLLEAFLSKKLETIEASPCWYSSYFGFSAILNALHVILYQQMFFLLHLLNTPYHVKNKIYQFKIYRFDKYILNLLFFILSLFLVNGPQALYVNSVCLKCISRTDS